MKAHSFFATLLAAIVVLAPLGAAEKQKPSARVGDYPFWTTKKRGYVGPFVPGLNGALQLSEEQKAKIASVRDEISNDEAVKAARGISKSDPSVTSEQREQARSTMEAAAARLRKSVDPILTSEQRALIEKINAAYAAAIDDVEIAYAERFASVKALEDRRALQEEKNREVEEYFLEKLNRLLTPEQKDAMKRAAEEEEKPKLTPTEATKSSK
jgi:Spy/CpxP family protein refolding chaperone